MTETAGLRYCLSLLGGLVIAALILLIVHGLVARHRFQSMGGPPETGANSQGNSFAPLGAAVQDIASPHQYPVQEMPPLPENHQVIAAFRPPVIPEPDLPLPQIKVPFDTIGGAPAVEFAGPSNQAPASASVSGASKPVLSTGDLVLVQRVQPKYPAQAALQGIQGSVTVRFTVEPDGSVSGPVVMDAKPRRGIFDEASLSAVLRWKFKPITAPTPTSVTLVFNLSKGG